MKSSMSFSLFLKWSLPHNSIILVVSIISTLHLVMSILKFMGYCLFFQVRFVDSILSNNSTDDHCREFVRLGGLEPLINILGLPNLPLDFVSSPACQSVSGVCKSILVSKTEDCKHLQCTDEPNELVCVLIKQIIWN